MSEPRRKRPRLSVADYDTEVVHVTRNTDLDWNGGNVTSVLTATIGEGTWLVSYAMTMRAEGFIGLAWVSPTGVTATTVIEGSQQYFLPVVAGPTDFANVRAHFVYTTNRPTTLYWNIEANAAGTPLAVVIDPTGSGPSENGVPSFVAMKIT